MAFDAFDQTVLAESEKTAELAELSELRRGWVERALACPALGTEPGDPKNSAWLFPHDSPAQAAQMSRALSTCGVAWERLAEEMGVDAPGLREPYGPRSNGSSKTPTSVVYAQKIAAKLGGVSPEPWEAWETDDSADAIMSFALAALLPNVTLEVLRSVLPATSWIIGGGGAPTGRAGGAWSAKYAHQMTIVCVQSLGNMSPAQRREVKARFLTPRGDHVSLPGQEPGVLVHSLDGGQPGVHLRSRIVTTVRDRAGALRFLWCGTLTTKYRLASEVYGAASGYSGWVPDDGRRLVQAINPERLPYA